MFMLVTCALWVTGSARFVIRIKDSTKMKTKMKCIQSFITYFSIMSYNHLRQADILGRSAGMVWISVLWSSLPDTHPLSYR